MTQTICTCGNVLAPHDTNGQCDSCYIKANTIVKK